MGRRRVRGRRPLLDQALQKIPTSPWLRLRARSSRGVEIRQNLDKALGLAEKVSPGEKHWILATEGLINGDAAKAKQEIDELQSSILRTRGSSRALGSTMATSSLI